MKRFLTLLKLVPILVLLSVVSTFAAARTVKSYVVSESTGSGYPGVTGTDVFTGQATDAVSPNIVLPFPFYFDGSSVAMGNCKVNTSGMLELFPLATDDGTFVYPTTNVNIASKAISAFAGATSGSLTSSVGYTTVGTAPQRIFIVYWSEMMSSAVGADPVNAEMQIRLFETSNKIEIIYGPNVTALPADVLPAGIFISSTTSNFLNIKPTGLTGFTTSTVTTGGGNAKMVTVADANLAFLTVGKKYTLTRALVVDEVFPANTLYNQSVTNSAASARPSVVLSGIDPVANNATISYQITGPINVPNVTPSIVYTAMSEVGVTGNANIPIPVDTLTEQNNVMRFLVATGIAAKPNGEFNFAAVPVGDYKISVITKEGTATAVPYLDTFSVALGLDIELTAMNNPLSGSKHKLSATGVPVSLKVKNVGYALIQTYSANVKIYKGTNPVPVYNMTVNPDETGFVFGANRDPIFPNFNPIPYGIGSYRLEATVTLNGDLDPSNNLFPRTSTITHDFVVSYELDLRAIGIQSPKDTVELGRPLKPVGLARNFGINDLARPIPAVMTVRKLSNNSVVKSISKSVESVPSEPTLNATLIEFDENIIITEAGLYTIELDLQATLDGDQTNNKFLDTIYVKKGLDTVYTIGAAVGNDFPTIQAAVDALYQRGISNSVVFELTDASYTVGSLTAAPALDLSSTIVGNNANSTITFRPRAGITSPITINLVSANGIGILLGQNTYPSNTAASVRSVFSNKIKDYANAGGYITFDGGTNKLFNFVLNSTSNFRAAFYLAQGASNNTIKNCVISDPNANDLTSLPGSKYNASITKYEFEADLAYSVGILMRSTAPYDSRTYVPATPTLTRNNPNFIDTLVNANNVFEGNTINGFAYGIASMGTGMLQKSIGGNIIHSKYYNNNNTIKNNLIENSTKAGIFLGFEENSKIESNRIKTVTGTTSAASGIIIGGEKSTVGGFFGYNTMGIKINANEISNVYSPVAAYGINVNQSKNSYHNNTTPVVTYTVMPNMDEMTIMTNNVIWGINSQVTRAGIALMTERAANGTSPAVVGYKTRRDVIVNNTIILPEDGIANTGMATCIGLAQATDTKVINNALLLADNTYGVNGNSAIISLFGQMPKTDNVVFDRNVYYYTANNNNDLARFTETNNLDEVYPGTGFVNEFKNLDQWQYWTKQDANSSWYNFSNEIEPNANNQLRVKTTLPINSKLNNNGMHFAEISMGGTSTLLNYVANKDIDGNSRGVAGARYDVGASEFDGRVYTRDLEVAKITSPITYKSAAGQPFSDVNYVMTANNAINVKALIRNNGNMVANNIRVRAEVYLELKDALRKAGDAHTFVNGDSVIKETYYSNVNVDPYGVTEVDFNIGNPDVSPAFKPKTYFEIGSTYALPTQFGEMKTTVTPVYRIVVKIDTEGDQSATNDTVSNDYRFFIKKSDLSVLVSAENANFDLTTVSSTTSLDQLVGKLNYDSLKTGINALGWKQYLTVNEATAYHFDVFNRSAWEPKAVDYTMYRNMFWSDGENDVLTRVEQFDISKFTNSAPINGGKKNLVFASQEVLRNNAKDTSNFLIPIFNGSNLLPNTPMGMNGTNMIDFDNKTIKGVTVAIEKLATVKSTGYIKKDALDNIILEDVKPFPALISPNNSSTAVGIVAPAFYYVDNYKNDPNAKLYAGVATSALSKNVVYLGQDWRHYGNIQTILRGVLDYFARNGSDIVPVELLDFDAIDRNKKVEISWSTLTEYQTDRFEIERADVTEAGITAFTTIATEPASGISSTVKTYGPIVDNSVNYGHSYIYRLRNYDVTGESTYSNEVEVTIDNFFGVSPNPAVTVSTYTFNVDEAQNVSVELYDVNGKVIRNIFNGMANGTQNVDINVTDLLNGTYTIVLKTDSQVYTTRLYVRK